LKNPYNPSLGRQNHRWIDHPERGKERGTHRRPISMIATR